MGKWQISVGYSLKMVYDDADTEDARLVAFEMARHAAGTVVEVVYKKEEQKDEPDPESV